MTTTVCPVSLKNPILNCFLHHLVFYPACVACWWVRRRGVHLERFEVAAWRAGAGGETQGSDAGIRCEELYGGCKWRERGGVLVSLANSALLSWRVAGGLWCLGLSEIADGVDVVLVEAAVLVLCPAASLCSVVSLFMSVPRAGKLNSPSCCLDLPMGPSACAPVRLEWEKPRDSGRALRLTSLNKLACWFYFIILQNTAKRRVILCNKFLII